MKGKRNNINKDGKPRQSVVLPGERQGKALALWSECVGSNLSLALTSTGYRKLPRQVTYTLWVYLLELVIRAK